MLTDREAEILALITQGKSNAEVAATTFLSPNTVKSYIRTIYRKIDVTSRTQAVLWGVRHGFTADHHRIDHWRVVHRGSCLPSWPKFVDPPRQLKSPEASRHRHAWPARDRPQLV